MSRVLLLSGGGFRGAVQVPVITELIKRYRYDAVYGVSVGALNGALMAQQQIQDLWHLWKEIDGISGFFKVSPWPFNGLYSMKPLRKKVEAYGSLNKLKIPFIAGVVSLTDGEYYNLSSENMLNNFEYWDAIEASCSISGAMKSPEIIINGRLHQGADGGFRNIVPIPEDSYDNVDVVVCTPIQRIKTKAPKFWNLGTLVFRGVEIMEDEVFDKDLSEILHKVKPGGILNMFAPGEDPGFSFDASRELIQQRLDIGYRMLEKPMTYIKS